VPSPEPRRTALQRGVEDRGDSAFTVPRHLLEGTTTTTFGYDMAGRKTAIPAPPR